MEIPSVLCDAFPLPASDEGSLMVTSWMVAWLIDLYRHLLMVIMMVLVHKHYRASLNLYFRLILHRNLHPFRQQVLLKEFYLQAHLLVPQP